MADTTSVVAEKNKGCNRKGELCKLVMEHLVAMGYNAAICKSKWEKSRSFPLVIYPFLSSLPHFSLLFQFQFPVIYM
ncbi:hypothetical protein RND81_09G183200 [Saponaria officinalis]|uniref:DNA-directed RNA polymerase n=1 Tax=Saponaria officinalis TaxID=3572 RepID=A0AAW1IP73_SAPOF